MQDINSLTFQSLLHTFLLTTRNSNFFIADAYHNLINEETECIFPGVKNIRKKGISPGFQQLRLCTLTAGSTSSILGRGTKIPYATQNGKKVKKKKAFIISKNKSIKYKCVFICVYKCVCVCVHIYSDIYKKMSTLTPLQDC